MNPSSHESHEIDYQNNQFLFEKRTVKDLFHSKNTTPASSIDELKTKTRIKRIQPSNRRSLAPTINLPNVYSNIDDQVTAIEYNSPQHALPRSKITEEFEHYENNLSSASSKGHILFSKSHNKGSVYDIAESPCHNAGFLSPFRKSIKTEFPARASIEASRGSILKHNFHRKSLFEEKGQASGVLSIPYYEEEKAHSRKRSTLMNPLFDSAKAKIIQNMMGREYLDSAISGDPSATQQSRRLASDIFLLNLLESLEPDQDEENSSEEAEDEHVKDIKAHFEEGIEPQPEDELLKIVEMDDFEKLDKYKDNLPFLEQRKKLRKLMKTISYICRKIIKNPAFEYICLVVIIFNTIVLVIEDPLVPESNIFNSFDHFFLVAYTIEMVLKIFALGFLFNKRAYLRDYWNILDFIIVVTAYIPIVISDSSGNSSGPNLSGLRALRVLRPLRTISSIKALKILLMTLFSALNLLLDTLIVLFFFFMIFAIAGLQLFSGLLKNRCFDINTGIPHPNDLICGYKGCPTDVPGTNYVCGKMIANPDFNVTNFDTIFYSLLQVFQSVTLEGWSDIMHMLQKSFSPFVAIYFVFLVFLGAFFLLNLTLAVIKTKYTQSMSEKKTVEEDNTKPEVEPVMQVREYKILRKRLERKQENYRLKKDRAATEIRLNLTKTPKSANDSKEVSLFLKGSQTPDTFDIDKTKSPLEGVTFTNLQTEINEAKEKQVGQRFVVFRPNSDSNNGTPSKEPLVKEKIDIVNSLFLKNKNINRKVHPLIDGKMPNDIKIVGKDEDTVKKFRMKFFGMIGLQDPANMGKKKDTLVTTLTKFGPVESFERLEKLETNKQNKDFGFRKNKQVIDLIALNSQLTSSKESPRELLSHRSSTRPQNLDSVGMNSEANNTDFLFNEDENLFDDMPPKQLSQIDRQNKRIKQIVPPIRKLRPGQHKYAKQGSNLSSSSFKLSRTGTLKSGLIIDENLPSDLLDNTPKAKKDAKILVQLEESNIQNQSLPVQLSFSTTPPFNNNPEIDAYSQFLASSLHQKPRSQPWNAKRSAKNTIMRNQGVLGPQRKSLLRSLMSSSSRRSTILLKTGNKASFFKKMKELEQKNSFWGRVKLRLTKIWDYVSAKSQTDLDESFTSEESESAEIEEKYSKVDFSQLKFHIEHSRDYASESIDDVLDERFEVEQREKHRREEEMFRKTKLQMIYQLKKDGHEMDMQTQTQPISEDRTSFAGGSKSMENSFSRAGSVQGDGVSDIRFSTATGAVGGGTFNASEKDGENGLSRAGSTVGRRRRRKKRIGKEKRQPDEFKMDYAVLHKLFATKFENENDLYALAQEVGFTNPLDYANIKRDDLKSFSIAKLNWSGNDVSKTWYNEQMVRAKQAIMFQDQVVWLPGFIGLLKIIRKKIVKLVNGKFFENFLMIVVVANTVILASDGLVDEDSQIISILSNLFSGIFIVEMAFKLIGLGISEYVRDKMNIFDGVTVLMSIAEWTVLSGNTGKAVSAFRTVRIFRTFRVLRVTRLLRALDFMQVIIHVVSNSLSSFTYIALLLVLFVFIYALLGMQVFAGELQSDKMGFRQNFDSFGRAFLTVFQVLTLENWNDILILTLNSHVNKLITVCYLVSWIFIGNYVFLNLFLAILLDGFTEEGIDDVLKTKKEIDEDYLFYYANNDNGQTEQKNDKSVSDVELSFNSADLDLDESIEGSKKKKALKQKPLFDRIHCNKSWCLFSKQNPIRKLTGMIVQHQYFESVILVTIILSSLKLIVDTYIPANPVSNSEIMLANISDNLDNFFNIFFAVEFALKSTYMGFIMDTNSYLRDNWNRLDFFIVVSSLIDMSVESINVPIIKILRLLRTLRPLRFISHNVNMKIMVTALLESFSAMLNVVIVVLLVWLMFAILGISLLKGRLGYCSSSSLTSSYGVSRSMCDSMGGLWSTYNANYENIFEAIMTLFVVSSLEGWPDIMYQAIDSGTDDEGPQKNGSYAFAGYYIGFILIGSFFFVNLFVGVIFYQFSKAQKNEKSKTSRFLGEDQQKWIEMQKLILSAKPKDPFIFAPKAKWSKFFQRIITSKLFDPIIMAAIIGNILVMAMSYQDSSQSYQNVLDKLNLGFTVIFILEMILKLLALGPKGYWFNGWNKFDAFVVTASIADLLMDSLGSEMGSFLRVGPQLARVLRVLRVTRLFRLAKSLQGLAALIETMIFSLPSMLNISALLFLVFFIYAVLGVFLYQNITQGTIINDYVNFANFGNAMVALFKASTGENWPLLMFDTMKTSNCTPNVDCGTPWSVLYFVSFIILLQFIMLNMFILIILQNFDEYYFKPDNPIKRFKENVESFSQTWTKKTRHSRGAKISKNQLIPFFTDLEPPLGMKGTSRSLIAKAILQMNLVGDALGNVYFNELLFAAMKRAYGEKLFNTKDPELLKYLAKEEYKTKARIELIKAKFQHQKVNPKETKKLIKGGGVNPLLEMLFVGMTLKAWRNYVPKYEEQRRAAELQGLEYVEPSSEEEEEEDIEENDKKEINFEYNDQPIESKSRTKPKIEITESDSVNESEEEPVFELDQKEDEKPPAFMEGLFQAGSPKNKLSRRLSQAFFNLKNQGLFERFNAGQDQKKPLSFLKDYLKAQEQFINGDKAISLEDVEKKRELAIKTMIIPQPRESQSPKGSRTNVMRQKSIKKQESPTFMRQESLQHEREEEGNRGRIKLFKRLGTFEEDEEKYNIQFGMKKDQTDNI